MLILPNLLRSLKSNLPAFHTSLSPQISQKWLKVHSSHVYFGQFWAVLGEDDKKYLNWQNSTFDNRC